MRVKFLEVVSAILLLCCPLLCYGEGENAEIKHRAIHDKVNQLKLGMTREEMSKILGKFEYSKIYGSNSIWFPPLSEGEDYCQITIHFDGDRNNKNAIIIFIDSYYYIMCLDGVKKFTRKKE